MFLVRFVINLVILAIEIGAVAAVAWFLRPRNR